MSHSGLRGIKAISFDGDMTLWDFGKVMRQSLGCALAELRRCAPCEASARLTVDRMIGIRDAVAAELRGRATDLEEIRLHAFKRTLEEIGVDDDDLAVHLAELYLKQRHGSIELYPDTLPALDALKPHYQLGLISNGNTYPERHGMQGLFAFVLYSQDFRAGKPDPAIFHAACGKAGCTPGELLHVGDSLETDVEGARRAGAVSVWLNRERESAGGAMPDYMVTTLTELVDMLCKGA